MNNRLEQSHKDLITAEVDRSVAKGKTEHGWGCAFLALDSKQVRIADDDDKTPVAFWRFINENDANAIYEIVVPASDGDLFSLIQKYHHDVIEDIKTRTDSALSAMAIGGK